MPTADLLLTSLTQKYNCTSEISAVEFYVFQDIVQASGNKVLSSEQSSSQIINRVHALLTSKSHQLSEDTYVALHRAGWNSCKGFPRPFLLKLCSLFSKNNGYWQIPALYQLCCFFSPLHLLQAEVMMAHISSLK